MSDVVLTSKEKGWFQWATQYAAASTQRHAEPFTGKRPSRAAILLAYRRAARRAGSRGLLIISAGHGFSGGFSKGAVDLAPAGVLRLSSAHLRYRNRLVSPRDKELVKTYEKIGAIVRKHKVKRVLLLSCSVGSSWDFLQQIANEWKAKIIAYRGLLEVGYITSKRQRKTTTEYFIFIKGKPPKSDLERAFASKNYPKLSFGDAWQISPK